MGAAYAPVLFDAEVVLEVEQQIVGGHLAAGEKVAGHPVVGAFVLVVVGVAAVREDVDEELAAGREPAGDFGKQELVVFHVLEHLDAHDAVELRGDVEDVHVARDDGEILESAAHSLGINVLLLRT